MRLAAGIVAALALAGAPALADRPKTIFIPTDDPTLPIELLGYNTIFLNRCAGGCQVHHGTNNSKTDTSSITNGGTLTAFPYSDQVWNDVVTCVADVFYPFNVNITDVRPASGDYFEIMVAGAPGDLGFDNNTGGVSPFGTCGVVNDSLVFDFAKVWNGSVEEICATAAQEVAHSFAMDHVADASDPMTYFQYSGRRYFKDGVKCGSDCVSGRGPFPPYPSCNAAGEHACTCGGSATQNDVSIIKTLFGPGAPQPITVKITTPENGDAEQPGFPIGADITNRIGISKAELRVDDQLILTIMQPPYSFNAPDTLGPGTHHIEVTGYDHYGATGKAAIDIIIGAPCMKPGDCPDLTQTCVGGRCVAGPGTQGGLGSPCTMGTECSSGQCGNDGTNSYCVEPCTPGQCPPSFGCLPTPGAMSPGVCWPGFDDGSGGGGCATGGGGTLSLGLVLAGFAFTRRKKR